MRVHGIHGWSRVAGSRAVLPLRRARLAPVVVRVDRVTSGRGCVGGVVHWPWAGACLRRWVVRVEHVRAGRAECLDRAPPASALERCLRRGWCASSAFKAGRAGWWIARRPVCALGWWLRRRWCPSSALRLVARGVGSRAAPPLRWGSACAGCDAVPRVYGWSGLLWASGVSSLGCGGAVAGGEVRLARLRLVVAWVGCAVPRPWARGGACCRLWGASWLVLVVWCLGRGLGRCRCRGDAPIPQLLGGVGCREQAAPRPLSRGAAWAGQGFTSRRRPVSTS